MQLIDLRLGQREVRLAALSQGRSRITERSPVTGSSQTSPTFMGLRSGAPFGSGCDIRAQVSHRGRLVGNSSPIDKGRVAGNPARIDGKWEIISYKPTFQVVVSKARNHAKLAHPLASTRFRYNTRTSHYQSAQTSHNPASGVSG